MDTWLSFLGRLHPLLLHLPIGGLLCLVATELWTRRPGAARLERGTRAFLCWLTALTVLTSAATGWLLGTDLESSGDTFWWHRALGIAFAVTTTCAALAALLGRGRAYGLALGVSLAVLFPLGHLGAEMTHGAGFLTEPFQKPAQSAAREQVAREQAPPVEADHARIVAPILAARCERCHGAEKQKGGFALHESARLLAGGDSGVPALVPGDPGASELLRRMRLDLEHEDHMPPPSKPQPTAAEIEAIERWIAAGAPFSEQPTPLGVTPHGPAPTTRPRPEPSAAHVPPAEAIARLVAAHVHVESVSPEEPLLWIDFRARGATDDAFLREHLPPLGPAVVELTLARTAITDAALTLVADLPRLERLDLSHTRCSDAGIGALRAHPALKSLNLTGTRVSDESLALLAELPALERLFLWDCAVTPAGLATLARSAPNLSVESGTIEPAAPIETEAPVALGAAGERDVLAPDLRAVNALCPVSGKPVDPRYRLVHAERVVGFCCAECPGRFWESPGTFSIEADR